MRTDRRETAHEAVLIVYFDRPDLEHEVLEGAADDAQLDRLRTIVVGVVHAGRAMADEVGMK